MSNAGNATPTPKSATSPWKGEWKMPDVGFKRTQQKATTPAKEGSGSFKTGRIARKLGQLAVANDLAYIPRLPDNAVVGINPDDNHSRESYLQAHNAAIDFTRQLPKGTQPAFFNPSTHTLVPLQEIQRHCSTIGLQTDQTPGPTPDLLDLEFMANKPQTMHTEAPSRVQTPKVNDAAIVRRHASQKAFQAFTQVRSDHQEVPPIKSRVAQKQDDGLHFNANTTQKVMPRIPTQLRPAPQTTATRPMASHAPADTDDRHELFYSPPPTFQDFPTFDALTVHTHISQTTLPTQQPRQRSITAQITTPQTHCLTPAKSLRQPATWQPVHETVRPAPSPKQPATYQPFTSACRPTGPPLSFDGIDIHTFSPKGTNTPTMTTRRQTTVHRQRTSQEIWNNQAQAKQTQAHAATQAHKQQQEQEAQRAAFDKAHAEKLKAMRDSILQDRQATEKAAFEKKHAERVKAMQDAIAADMAKERKQNRLRPVARTFEPDVEEHKVRTRTFSPTTTSTSKPVYKPYKDNTTAKEPTSFRPTARTFHLDHNEHSLRPRTKEHVYQQAKSPMQAQKQSNTPISPPTPSSTPFRRWQPNPNARTFEAVNDAACFAAGKRRAGAGGNGSRE